jgi:hypothetical protein
MEQIPVSYRKNLGPELSRRLDEFLNQDELVTIREEAALARMMSDKAVLLYRAALTAKLEDESKRGLLIGQATANLQDALDFASRVGERCSRVEAALSDKMSPEKLQLFVAQLLQCVAEVLDHDEAKMQEVRRLFNQRLQLPASDGYDPEIVVG